MHDPGGETNFYLKFMEINYSGCELPNGFCLYYCSHHLSWCNLSIFQAFSVMQSVCRCIKQKLKLEKCSRGRKDPHLLCCHNFLLKVNEVKICAQNGMDQFNCVWFFQPFEMVVDSVTGDQTDWLS